MRSAVIVVDMLEETFDPAHPLPISEPARAIVPAIDRLTAAARAGGHPVVFACDSFLEGDFLFGGKMQPHALRGTPGAEPTALLHREPGDVVLPKRRFSAFFKTDLDQTLRTLGVEAVAVAGITTHFCVLTTALDAVALDLRAVLVEDCCAAPTPQMHAAALDLYRRNPLWPLLRVMPLADYLPELSSQGHQQE